MDETTEGQGVPLWDAGVLADMLRAGGLPVAAADVEAVTSAEVAEGRAVRLQCGDVTLYYPNSLTDLIERTGAYVALTSDPVGKHGTAYARGLVAGRGQGRRA